MSRDFVPSGPEIALANAIFAQGDHQNLGILTGDVAVRIFTGAKLPQDVLHEIWNIADEENNGWLSKKSTALALRLIGHAQRGQRVSKNLISMGTALFFAAREPSFELYCLAGPVPIIEGFAAPLTQQNTGKSSLKSPPPSRLPPLTQQDKINFQSLFMRSGPVNGLISGKYQASSYHLCY